MADRRLLYAGHIQQAFPAPLVKTAAGWRFDGEAGAKELAARRIRRNETAAIELCQRFLKAEYAYSGKSASRSFAAKIRSTPGRHDGLFWQAAGEEDESPIGPPFAAAAFAERKPGDGTRPLFGYYFKILSAQGANAAGFALVAWPAEQCRRRRDICDESSRRDL